MKYLSLFGLAALLAANVLLFPKLDLYVNHPEIMTLLTAVLGTALAAVFLHYPASDAKMPLWKLFLPVGVFFGFLFFNLFMSVDNEFEILENTGVRTEAVITDKQHYRIKRNHVYYLLLEFKNDKGEIVDAKVGALEDEYNRYEVGQTVQIIYGEKNNQLVHFYSETPDVTFGAAEMLKIIGLDGDSVTNYLKGRHALWQFDIADSTWQSGELYLKLYPKSKVVLATSEIGNLSSEASDVYVRSRFAKEFRALKFKEELGRESVKFTNTVYKAEIGTTTDSLSNMVSLKLVLVRK